MGRSLANQAPNTESHPIHRTQQLLGSALREAWNYKISLAPVAATYLLFDLPAITRKLTGVAYVPIYFIFFPLGHSDRLYAQYFNEDLVYRDGAS